eukprot:s3208_g5.t1
MEELSPGLGLGGESGAKERRKRCFDQVVHIVVMALNFLHADFRFVSPASLAKILSEAQLKVIQNVRAMIKAFGVTAVYRPLEPKRLKIVGQAAWDAQPYMPDDLWVAFVEPASLIWTQELPVDDCPDLSKESFETTLELAKLWDVQGLLFLREVPEQYRWQHGAMRLFNNYKNVSCDRMIGDRPLRNFFEGRVPRVSRALPVVQMMTVFEVNPTTQKLSICVSDRRDFYRQFKVIDERQQPMDFGRF